VRSYSVVPYGQSEDPTSLHYTDQGRCLFSEAKLKDTWFSRERLEGHIESRQVIDDPDADQGELHVPKTPDGTNF
jgi:hypothetical protein